MIQISVVVCTYNRANMLAGALESLVQQTVDKGSYEIIVVDNGSTDATSEVTRNFQARYRVCNIMLVREDRLGLAYARNAGSRQARGNYVAFMDDDARASPNWLDIALRCFEEVQPPPIGIGGPILPLYDSPKPTWFKDEYEIRSWGEQPRFLKQGETFSGSNMILRKEILEVYGGFDVRLGVQGEYLGMCEETALFMKIWQLKDDAVFYYSPRLVMFHAVPSHRMTVSYPLKRAFSWGQSWYLMEGPKSVQGRLRLFLGMLISIARLSRLALLHRREYSAYYQNWIVESCGPIARETGRLAASLGLFIPMRQRER